MKKITLFLGALFIALGAYAADPVLNNPKDANGNMIFKWDCATNSFATSNDFEIDQNVVFAVDVTGTPLEAWLTQAPTGITRAIAFDFWTQWGGNLDGRFAKIKTNIYGATLNFAQFATSRQKQLIMFQGTSAAGTAFTVGTQTELYSNIFGFGYTLATKDWGTEWWQNAMITAVSMKTAPYTGTKISAEYFKGDQDNTNFYPGGFDDWGGYAAPCASLVITDVKNPSVSDSPIVGYEYYTILGGKLQKQPQSGMYIQKAIRENGTLTTTKIFKK